MKICAYEVRGDEIKDFKLLMSELDVEIALHEEVPSRENTDYLIGCEGVTILGQGCIDRDLLDIWYRMGIRYISTRTIGYNHIDIEYAKDLGIMVCNATYPPSSVAEFTLMLMLMCLRNYKQALWRGQVNDFSLNGLQGKEICDLTIGIIGTGKIGSSVIKLLSSFGCKIIAYSKSVNPSIMKYVTYVSIEELYEQADVISLHVALTRDTYHLINDETISKMKEGVLIVNCARGELCDTDALIRGIENGKIGSLGLDVIEGETGITHVDHRIDILCNQKMAYLRQFRNVVMTPHMAFYTDTAVESMVRCGIEGIISMKENKDYDNIL